MGDSLTTAQTGGGEENNEVTMKQESIRGVKFSLLATRLLW